MSFRAKSLLAFVLEPTLPVSDWLAALDDWLARSPSFFAVKPVVLDLAAVNLDVAAYRELLAELVPRQIRVMAVENAAEAMTGPDLPPVVSGGRAVSAPAIRELDATPQEAAKEPEVPKPLYIDGNVRSGQTIMHPRGDVIIVGRVASGAEIIAGGSVHVYGALQGRVFAGTSGLPGARIFCREAHAELLCIGGAYVTAENMDSKVEGRSIEARLDGEELAIRILD